MFVHMRHEGGNRNSLRKRKGRIKGRRKRVRKKRERKQDAGGEEWREGEENGWSTCSMPGSRVCISISEASPGGDWGWKRREGSRQRDLEGSLPGAWLQWEEGTLKGAPA